MYTFGVLHSHRPWSTKSSEKSELIKVSLELAKIFLRVQKFWTNGNARRENREIQNDDYENSGDGMPRFKTNSRLELAANGFSIADIFNRISSSPPPLIHLIWKSIWQLNPRPIRVMSSSFSKIVPFPRNGCGNHSCKVLFCIVIFSVHRNLNN